MDRTESRQYTRDEVDRIIRRALRLKKDEVINHNDLIDMARDLGVDSQTMNLAIEEEQRTYNDRKALRSKLIRRKAKFHAHLWSYIIVIGALILINIMTPGPWWFQWPMFGWGIGLAFHLRAAYFPVEVELESDRLNED
jgi:hypothetical protein